MADVPPDSLAAVYSLLVLIFNDELGEAGKICETALAFGPLPRLAEHGRPRQLHPLDDQPALRGTRGRRS
jgi:hypothetical protein